MKARDKGKGPQVAAKGEARTAKSEARTAKGGAPAAKSEVRPAKGKGRAAKTPAGANRTLTPPAAKRAPTPPGRTRAPAPAAASRRRRKRGRPHKVHPAARRQAILDAALAVFAERGYAAARLEDVAVRVGVAKGTLYLHFEDKEALFEALIRSAVSPIMQRVGAAASAPGTSAADVLDTFFALFQKEVLGTRRKLLLRLLIAEGPRFPALAEFYHREVVSRGLELMRAVARQAVARGEFSSDAAARFPQLIVAPLLVAVIWDALFSRLQPLDVAGLLRAHRDLLTARPGSAAS
jgi:AcrR family transcriptional regulator